MSALHIQGSWKAPSPFLPCIGTMNHLIVARQRESADKSDALQNASRAAAPMDHASAFGVRASSAPLSHASPRFDDSAGSSKALSALMPCIGTMNSGIGAPASGPARSLLD